MSLPERKLRRFYGTVEFDATRGGRDAGQVGEAVIRHLAGQMGAQVKGTLEIEAELPEGRRTTWCARCRSMRGRSGSRARRLKTPETRP